MKDSLETTRININRNKKHLKIKILDTNSNKFLDSSIGGNGNFNRTIISNISRKHNNINSSMDMKFNTTTRRYIFGDHSMNYEDLKPDSDNVLKDYKYDSLIKKEEDNENKDLKEALKNNDKININENITTIKPIYTKDKLDEIFEDKYENLFNTKTNFIKTVRFKKLESIKPESQTKIYIHDQNYQSPIKSFSVIKKNEVIFDSMIKNYHEVQKNKYVNFLKEVDEKAIVSKPEFKKIKISQMIPKKNKFQEISEEQERENLLKEKEKEKKQKEKEKNCNLFFL